MRCRRCCSASIPGWPHGSGSDCSFSAWWVYVRSRRQHRGDARFSTNCGDVHGHAADVPKDRQEKREKRETKFYSCLRVRYVHGHAANVPKRSAGGTRETGDEILFLPECPRRSESCCDVGRG